MSTALYVDRTIEVERKCKCTAASTKDHDRELNDQLHDCGVACLPLSDLWDRGSG